MMYFGDDCTLPNAYSFARESKIPSMPYINTYILKKEEKYANL